MSVQLNQSISSPCSLNKSLSVHLNQALNSICNLHNFLPPKHPTPTFPLHITLRALVPITLRRLAWVVLCSAQVFIDQPAWPPTNSGGRHSTQAVAIQHGRSALNSGDRHPMQAIVIQHGRSSSSSANCHSTRSATVSSWTCVIKTRRIGTTRIRREEQSVIYCLKTQSDLTLTPGPMVTSLLVNVLHVTCLDKFVL